MGHVRFSKDVKGEPRSSSLLPRISLQIVRQSIIENLLHGEILDRLPEGLFVSSDNAAFIWFCDVGLDLRLRLY
jgi:hypothetical protein